MTHQCSPSLVSLAWKISAIQLFLFNSCSTCVVSGGALSGGSSAALFSSSPRLPDDDSSTLEELSDDVLLEVSEDIAQTEARTDSSDSAQGPHLIRLRRESVPVYRKGKVASFKTSYSGLLKVGHPAQDFHMVFDTGSGNVVVPAAECLSESCLIHRRYDMKASESAQPVQVDGTPLKDGEESDQVTIGFGTGSVTGEFVRDRICISSAKASDDGEERSGGSSASTPSGNRNSSAHGPCLDMTIVIAKQMSAKPFKTFNFDGIIGLGLPNLAINPSFSAFGLLSGMLAAPRFAAFLTDGEHGEESEMALGGYNPERILGPLSWAPAAMPELGYWQVEILAVRVNGIELDICADGTCRGVVDTGTSHLGVPAPHDVQLEKLLTVPAEDTMDCRLAEAPEVELQLRGFSLRIGPGTYMRRLPLRPDVTVGSHSSNSANAEEEVKLAMENAAHTEGVDQRSGPERICRPRLLPVKMPAPLGPKLFILGEPILHQYYTVYDWNEQAIGFGLANSWRNTATPDQLAEGRGVLPTEVDMLLMQETMETSVKGHRSARTLNSSSRERSEPETGEEERLVLMQMGVSVEYVESNTVLH